MLCTTGNTVDGDDDDGDGDGDDDNNNNNNNVNFFHVLYQASLYDKIWGMKVDLTHS
jgi:hypothetical protein